ncbi:MAG TPA: hypothetical protein VKG82_01585 [Solirubrobacteraceae bacterium]|nr:hypothetical protein [Solirubrobacteraceae bacterium]
MSRARQRQVAALACALAPVCLPAGALAASQGAAGTAPGKLPASATLEQCVTAVEQGERSATFVGEMTAVAGTARMLMRIDVLERPPDEVVYHTVSYPGLGVWLRSSPGVKTYKDLDKVTDLSAPAEYRAAIRFRWLNAKGHLIKALELRTPRCDQPPPASAPAASGPAVLALPSAGQAGSPGPAL